MEWETVIGLEVHAQLATSSKIFSGASTSYGAAPNTQACAVDLGFPGVLPVMNATAVQMAVIFGIAIEAEIAERSIMARKNYFYPDLPKGYQISQYESPIVANGRLPIVLDGNERVIDITRAHLEEDAGKSLHGEIPGATGIDLNRAGTPLLEIVSEPVMRSAKEAVAYMRELHRLVRYLGICDGNMQEGSFRCDANVSVRPRGSTTLGTRTETKNLNSFRFVERAIDFEVERQIDILTDGGEIVQETRLYDADADETRSMRSKEDAHDYRYFPDPDLLPIEIEKDYILGIRAKMPELPAAKRKRFMDEHQLSMDDAAALTNEPETARYFEAALNTGNLEPKLVANWVLGDLFGAINKSDCTIDTAPVSAAALAGLLLRITDGSISGKIAKQVFQAMWEGKGSADEIIETQGLKQVSDTGALEAAVDAVIAEFPEQVAQYRGGKEKVLGFLVGQVMKRTKGQANPKAVNEIMRGKL